ncbi:MAG: cytochrome c biogenesis protein CcsA [Verrucomicrobiota bacterium JB025]|nr:cytochrome c biogenesis protein CcsA [Verrucomicrobiota bacterium JB025]
MDRWILLISTLTALIGAVWGMRSVHHGHRSHWTVVWMAVTFALQLAFLFLRGQARAACPLADSGEILSFLAWALTFFYLLVGPTYRISLLGVFTAPVVVAFQAIALIPGMLDAAPATIPGGNPWHETHSATAVLSYGAFALAAVAAVMFLTLDKQLKAQHLKSGLFRNLPPVRELLVSLTRLLWLGTALLTIGVIAGTLMPKDGAAPVGHLLAAYTVWTAYAALLAVKSIRGLTGRRFSLATVGLFILSLGVFAFV